MNDLTIYNQYRPQMKSGDLLAYRSNSVIATLIHIWSKQFNHVGMVLDLSEYAGQECRKWTLGADSRGVALSLLSIDLSTYHGEVWWYPLLATDEERHIIAEFGLCAAGSEYDYWSLIKNIWGLVPIDMLKYFCSEYVYCAYKKARLPGTESDKAPRPDGIVALPIYKEPIQIIYYEDTGEPVPTTP